VFCQSNPLTFVLILLIQPEILEGPNQFFCNTCESKQNVVRYVKLQKLPPYLNLQLLRFVFDRQKGRRKLNSFIKFPETLSLSKYFDNGVEIPEKAEYNLCAVLMHRGQSAHSGHYIAQIKDRITEDWFKFNDEFVEKIEGKNLKLGFEENGDNYAEAKSSSPTEDKQMPKLNKGQHASNDAYMLVYKRSTLDDKSLPADDSFKWDIPEYLQTVLLEDNTQFEERVEVYNQLKSQNLAINKEKQDEIKTVYEQLIQNERLSDCEWISKDWLCQWLSFDLSAPISLIDNTSAVCAHNRLSIGAVDQMKLISSKGADLIFAKYGGDLRLKDCLCLECVQNKAQSIQRRHKINEDSKRITSLLKFSLPIAETAFWVGKESLKVWKHLALKQCDLFESSFMLNKSRSNSTSDAICLNPESSSSMTGETGLMNQQNSSSENGDSDSENKPPSQSDRLNEIFIDQINFNFNEDILCPHGKCRLQRHAVDMLPNHFRCLFSIVRLTYDDTKRRLVSPSVWNLLKSHFVNASEFDSEATPCEECLVCVFFLCAFFSICAHFLFD
jgi:ubiquitin carboxyl-terminal hydrolase 48